MNTTITKQIVPTKTWTKPGRDKWPNGPWADEPDKVQWQFNEYIACMVKRGPLGAWCGYAGVTPGHPLYQVGYNAAYDKEWNKKNTKIANLMDSISVHGGLTYAAMCDGEEETGICHVAKGTDGQEVEAWWLGFDCGHYGDLVPYVGINEPMRRDFVIEDRMNIYRDYDYVRDETENLARQLAEMM